MGKSPPSTPGRVASPRSSWQPRRQIIRACAKHGRDNHASFHPIRHLSLRQLPESIRTTSTMRLVRRLAQLVVRVRVMAGSNQSQQKTPQTGRGMSGDWKGFHGGHTCTCTGVVTALCEDCVTVTVPLHAVQDVEALHTTADFFYNSEEDRDNMITVPGLTLTRTNDLCRTAQLTCRACPKLGRRLRRVRDSISTTSAEWLTELAHLEAMRRSMEGSVAVLVSHPHGFPKSVSFGKFCGLDFINGSGAIENGVPPPKVLREGVEGDRVSGSRRMLMPSTSGSEAAVVSSQPVSCVSSSSSSSSSSPPPSSSSSSSPPPPPPPSSSSSSSPPPPPSSSSSSSSTVRVENLELGETSADYGEMSQTSHPPVEDSFVLVSVDNEIAWTSEKAISRMGEGEGGGGDICSWFISLLTASYRILGRLGRGVFDFPRGVSQKVVRLYHDAASCPGSSGGVMLVIGRRAWRELNEMETSWPVFMHVGVRGVDEGVAVPVMVDSKVLRLCCV